MGRQWSFVADMNGDYATTISDVWLWIKWIYFYPGDLLMYGVMEWTTPLAVFFEMGYDSFGGVASGVISFVAWATMLSVVSTVDDLKREQHAR